MPEPLSIAVAVAGLIKAACSVTITLTALTTGIQKAPKAVRDLLNETKAVTRILRQLESYLNSAIGVSRSGSSLISLEEVVTVITDCVCALSELESVLSRVKTEKPGAIDRLKWVWHADAVIKITHRIERHKTSLNLMLSILTCQAQTEAAEASAKVLTLVEELLTANPDLLSRLRSSEYARSTAESVAELADDGTSTIIPGDVHGPAHGESISFPVPVDGELESLSNGTSSTAFTVDIEMSLQASRVYRRAQRQRVRSSVAFDGQTIGSSFLSGISLSEISNLTVIALPIKIDEITNSQHYVTTPLSLFDFSFGDPPIVEDSPLTGASLESQLSIDCTSPLPEILNDPGHDHEHSKPKALLQAALGAATEAVLLDPIAFNNSDATDVDQSITKYQEAMRLLGKVRDQTRASDDKNKLSNIHDTYADRVELLQKSERGSGPGPVLPPSLAVLDSPVLGFEDDDTLSESDLEFEAEMEMAKVERDRART